MEKTWKLEVALTVRSEPFEQDRLEVRNSYMVKADDLLSVLKILAELEAFTRDTASRTGARK